MGLRLIEESGAGQVVMYCSTSMWAFGPVFESTEHAEAFIKFCEPKDPRSLLQSDLEDVWQAFCETYHQCEQCGEWSENILECPHCEEVNETIERR